MEEMEKTTDESKPAMSIEESFAALDEMVEQLESEDISLEESFKLYEKGMALLKDLNGRIDRVEKQMQLIDEAGRTEDFE